MAVIQHIWWLHTTRGKFSSMIWRRHSLSWSAQHRRTAVRTFSPSKNKLVYTCVYKQKMLKDSDLWVAMHTNRHTPSIYEQHLYNVWWCFFFLALPFGNHINKVVSHPTLPVTITAHEDKHIKFYDNKSGRCLEYHQCSAGISPIFSH